LPNDMGTQIKDPGDVLKRTYAVGAYYGFRPFSHIAREKKGGKNSLPYPETLALPALDGFAREVASFLKQVRDMGFSPSTTQPLFVWHTNAASGRPSPRTIIIQFHALGADRAIADAVLMRAIRSLMSDLGKEDSTIRINSMGDKETRGRLTRELNQFFRKHGPVLSPDCVTCARRDVFEALDLLHDEDVRAHIPSPTDHLSEASRKHFETVLEYLEATETPYELAPDLLSRGNAWAETCFEIQGENTLYAWGSRYSELARHFFKTSVPSVGAVIKVNVGTKAVVPSFKERSSPRFVFVHIGDEAKRESIKMADTLRKARIPIAQSIGIESLTEQMRLAERLNPPYLLIMGRKEALERSVILRERATHSELSIPLDGLVDGLRAVV
jgi:histidyl-tRNA synthetase